MIHKIFLLTAIFSISLSVCLATVSDTSVVENNFFNAHEPHGFNLKSISDDQRARRAKGEGSGFSTDVLLYSGNKQKIKDALDAIKNYNEAYRQKSAEIKSLKSQIESTINPLKKQQLSKDIRDHHNEMTRIEQKITEQKEAINRLDAVSAVFANKIMTAAKRMGHPEITKEKISRIPPYSIYKEKIAGTTSFPPPPNYPAPPPPNSKAGMFPPEPNYPAPPPPAASGWKKGNLSH